MLLKPTQRFRRKRVSVGKDWTPEQMPSVDLGLICKNCHKRILWKNLDTMYERQGSDLFRLWICECGNVIREDNMTDLNMVYELEQEM
jgi:hypothetical protein